MPIKALGLGALLIASVVISLSGCFASRGGSTEEATVRSFLAALQANDSRALAALVHPDYTGGSETLSFLERYGGRQLESVQIAVEPNSIASYLATARVTAAFTLTAGGSATAIEFQLPLKQVGSRWFIVLGEPRGGRKDRGQPTIPKP